MRVWVYVALVAHTKQYDDIISMLTKCLDCERNDLDINYVCAVPLIKFNSVSLKSLHLGFGFFRLDLSFDLILIHLVTLI